MSYLEVLKWLLALGDKLPTAFDIIDNIVNEFETLLELFGIELGTIGNDKQLAVAADYPENSEEAKLERELIEKLGNAYNNAIDGRRLRDVIKMLIDSGLISALMAGLASKVPLQVKL